jgi:hypothetical protein
MSEADIAEEGHRVGVGASVVDGAEGMVDPAEDEVVNGRQQQQREVSGRRGLEHEREHVIVMGDGPRDPVVQRRRAERRVGDQLPHGAQLGRPLVHLARTLRATIV